MKKIVFCLVLALSTLRAEASSLVPYMTEEDRIYATAYNKGFNKGFDKGYNRGYNSGRKTEKEKIAKVTMAVVGVAIVSIISYKLGERSSWTANENGIAYRF